jgi:hypothetical protein
MASLPPCGLRRLGEAEAQLERAEQIPLRGGEPGTELLVRRARGLLLLAEHQLEPGLNRFHAADGMQVLLVQEHTLAAETAGARAADTGGATGETDTAQAELAAIRDEQRDRARSSSRNPTASSCRSSWPLCADCSDVTIGAGRPTRPCSETSSPSSAAPPRQSRRTRAAQRGAQRSRVARHALTRRRAFGRSRSISVCRSDAAARAVARCCPALHESRGDDDSEQESADMSEERDAAAVGLG